MRICWSIEFRDKTEDKKMVRPIMKDVFFLNQFTRQKWRAMEEINKAGLQIYVGESFLPHGVVHGLRLSIYNLMEHLMLFAFALS